MALRNFWVNVKVDGYKTELHGGPRARDGGMKINVLQRENGSKKDAVEINCFENDGKLITAVNIGGEEVARFVTDR